MTRIPFVGLMFCATLSLVACGGGGSNNNDVATTVAVGGAGVKGPLIGAEVNLFQVDLTAADLRGAALTTTPGTTGADAAIEGLNVADDIAGLVLLEFLVVDGTTDLTTGAAPIFDNLITVVDAQRILDGDDIYASVLTTMAVNLALDDGSTTEAEFLAALDTAQNQVTSTLGFGLDSDTDIFTTPPLITDDTTSAADQAEVAAYRQAIEAVAAIANEVSEAGGGATAQEALEALTEDLSDGDIDGQSDEGVIDDLATVPTLTTIVTQDVTMLMIPGTNIAIGDIEMELAEEAEDTGTTTDTMDLLTGNISVDPEPAELEADSDGDGVVDSEDVFPNDPAEIADTDGDGVGDNGDAFPEDDTETTDTDGDGTGDNADAFPEDDTETTDTDGDGTGDNADAFPNDETETTDTDGDGTGDNADAFPEDDTETTDTDGDGTGDNADVFPSDPANQTDADGDGLGDETDDAFPNDTDNDGIPNDEDDFPNVPNDSDNDGVPDDVDNCVFISNPGQEDDDNNGTGNVCDVMSGAVWDEFNWDEADWQ